MFSACQVVAIISSQTLLVIYTVVESTHILAHLLKIWIARDGVSICLLLCVLLLEKQYWYNLLHSCELLFEHFISNCWKDLADWNRFCAIKDNCFTVANEHLLDAFAPTIQKWAIKTSVQIMTMFDLICRQACFFYGAVSVQASIQDGWNK